MDPLGNANEHVESLFFTFWYILGLIGFTKSIMMVAINCREISTHPFSVHPHKHALEEIKCCKFYEQTLSILVSIIICL